MNRALTTLLMLVSCGVACGNALDPPERVARISYLIGPVSFHTSGANTAARAILNWPVTAGDRIVTSRGARAELSLGTETIRLDEATDLTVLRLDQVTARLLVVSGAASVHVTELRSDDDIAIQAPQVTIYFSRSGDYRINVAGDGTATVVVRGGEARIDTRVATFQQLAGEQAHIAIDRTVAIAHAPGLDEFDQWSRARQSQFSGARAAQHVARGLVGYEDLDTYGAWHWERDYGMVWEPKRVATDWAPYRSGQWIWKQPWGWTWVDEAPWGFAPFHYGRWIYLREHWSWLPGPRQIAPVYAPALVRWIGDSGDRATIGWTPLGPHEEFIPAYPASDHQVRSLNTFANVRRALPPADVPRADGYAPNAVTWATRSAFARADAVVMHER